MGVDFTEFQHLHSGGEVGLYLLAERMSGEPLRTGQLGHWPAQLHDTLRITLNSNFPHIVYWGPALHTFWNDAAKHFFKGQHPVDLGRPLEQVQPDVMRTLRPLLREVMETGRAIIRHDLQLLYRRDDYTEEIYEVFSYSPLLDSTGQVRGIVAPIFDTTTRVINERRMALLADLATGTRGARTLPGYYAALASCLQRHPHDLPLAALYVGDEEDDGSGRAALKMTNAPDAIWPAVRTLAGDADAGDAGLTMLKVREVVAEPRRNVWACEPQQMVALPVLDAGAGRRGAQLVVALNPYKRLNADYQTFLTLVAAQIGHGMADTLALEQAADRALADIASLTRLTTMGELATSIAHEVNQPLAAMVIDAHASHRWLAATPSNLHEASAALRRIAINGEHAGNVLAKIRRFLRRSSGPRSPVDLVQVAWESLQLIGGQARRSQVALRARFAADIPTVHADRTQIQQVMLNLLMNAIEAMPDETSADASTDATPRTICVSIGPSTTPPGVKVAVQDNGSGIDRDQAARLFEAFHSTKVNGLGFGLSISRSIVESHGGLIWAEPASPRGAVFAFVLPLDEATA
ncbi:hypothetical protein BH09PSE5_BH09PSE5_32980 [soil metagenome]